MICHLCGANLEAERRREDGPFVFDPTVPAFMIDGAIVRCRPQVRQILGTLMHARGRTLSFDVLAQRLGSEANVAARLIDVALHEIRKIFAAAGHPCPVERVRGEGLRWRRL